MDHPKADRHNKARQLDDNGPNGNAVCACIRFVTNWLRECDNRETMQRG